MRTCSNSVRGFTSSENLPSGVAAAVSLLHRAIPLRHQEGQRAISAGDREFDVAVVRDSGESVALRFDSDAIRAGRERGEGQQTAQPSSFQRLKRRFPTHPARRKLDRDVLDPRRSGLSDFDR